MKIQYCRRDFIFNAFKTLALCPVALDSFNFNSNENHKDKQVNPCIRAGKLFDKVKQIDAGVLNVGYVDEGPPNGRVIFLLHGWPYDIHSFIDVIPPLTEKGYRVIVPFLRGFGSTTFRNDSTFRNGQQSVFAADIIALMDALAIKRAIIAGFDWGARTANVIAALWPERCISIVSVSGYLIGNQEVGKRPLSPASELQWWYQFYFATERGKIGYEKNRDEFAKLIWRMASPTWKFDESIFKLAANSFNNPDHVAIVIHNYRWRLGMVKGESVYDGYESRLAKSPLIKVPTITIEGDANGAPHPEAESYAKKFTGKYSHRVFKGVGHNPPMESPDEFAEVVLEAVDSSFMSSRRVIF